MRVASDCQAAVNLNPKTVKGYARALLPLPGLRKLQLLVHTCAHAIRQHSGVHRVKSGQVGDMTCTLL